MRASLRSWAWVFSLFPLSLNADAFYVTQGTNAVQVIDVPSFQVVATITVGTGPSQPVVTPNQERVYVPNGTSDNVSVIDTSTNLVIATISVGDSPSQASEHAVTPDGQFVYISNTLSDDISVISTATNTVIATIPVTDTSNVGGVGQSLFITPNGQFAYFPLSTQHSMIKVSTATNTIVATIPLGGDPFYVVGPPTSSQTVYVLNGNNIQAVSTTTNSVIAIIPLGSNPQGFFRVSADGLFMYVDNFTSTNVSVISTASNTVVVTIPVGVNVTFFPSVSPDGALGYSPAPLAGQVNVVSRLTGTVIATIPTASNCNKTYSDPDVQWVFAINPNSNSVSVINTTTKSVVATVSMTNPQLGAYVQSLSPTPSGPAVSGKQIANRFLTQTDLVNVIRWTPPADFTPVTYQIFRDASLTVLAGSVSDSTLYFEDHNRKKKQLYSYFIIAVDAVGNTTDVGSITVVPIE